MQNLYGARWLHIFGVRPTLHSCRCWSWVGYMGILASILFYRSTRSGRMDTGIPLAIHHRHQLNANSGTNNLHAAFDTLLQAPRSVMRTLIFLAVNAVILLRVEYGAVMKASNVPMPVPFVIPIICPCIQTLLRRRRLRSGTSVFQTGFFP